MGQNQQAQNDVEQMAAPEGDRVLEGGCRVVSLYCSEHTFAAAHVEQGLSAASLNDDVHVPSLSSCWLQTPSHIVGHPSVVSKVAEVV